MTATTDYPTNSIEAPLQVAEAIATYGLDIYQVDASALARDAGLPPWQADRALESLIRDGYVKLLQRSELPPKSDPFSRYVRLLGMPDPIDIDSETADAPMEIVLDNVPVDPPQPMSAQLTPWDTKTSQWEWQREVIRCRNVTETGLRVAMALALKCDSRTGEVYRASKTLADDIGRSRGQADTGRANLRDHGWITESGWNNQATKVWRLTLPQCSCGQHPSGVPGDSGQTS